MKKNEFEAGSKFSYEESIAYVDKGVVSKSVIKTTAGNISLFAFDKGEGLSEHTAPFDAVALIVDGRAEILIDGKQNILNSGESIIMPARIPHALKAVEKFKMVLTMIKNE